MTISDVEKGEQFNRGMIIGFALASVLIIIVSIIVMCNVGFHKNEVVSTPDGLGVVKSNVIDNTYEIWNINNKSIKKYAGSEVKSYRIGQ